MTKNNDQKQPDTKKPSILQTLFGRPERDTEYMSDLKGQWEVMSKSERVKFVTGAVFGLILFVGALAGVLYILSLLRG